MLHTCVCWRLSSRRDNTGRRERGRWLGEEDTKGGDEYKATGGTEGRCGGGRKETSEKKREEEGWEQDAR